MIENLIGYLFEYKTLMSYKNMDFDADKPIQYKELWYKLALKYEEEDVSSFGAAKPFLLPDGFDSLLNKDKIETKVASIFLKFNFPEVAFVWSS